MAHRYPLGASKGSTIQESDHPARTLVTVSRPGIPSIILGYRSPFNYFNWGSCRWTQPSIDVTTWSPWYVLLHARHSESWLVRKGNFTTSHATAWFGQQVGDSSAEVFRVNFYMPVALSKLEKAHPGPSWSRSEASSTRLILAEFSGPHIHLEGPSQNGKTLYKKQFPRNQAFKFKGLEDMSTPFNR